MTKAAVQETNSDSKGDVTRIAGRGAVYISAAKIWFMVSGYGIYYALPRLISEAEFGAYQVVVGIVSIINAVVITGTYQTVSKYVSQEEHKADAVKRKALKLQLFVGGAGSLGFFLLAPLVAARLNDSELVRYFRLASLITLFYSFYAVFTGYLNGRRKFLTQAALDATYSTLKVSFIVALVWLGYGIGGGIGGFAAAAGTILVISALVVGRGRAEGEVSAKELFRFQAYLLAFTLALNLLQKVDLILIKSLSSPDPLIASTNAGHYGAAIGVANLTYQIVISVTFIIFPLVSRATFESDRLQTGRYILNTTRYTLMIMALPATLFSANSREILRLIYPDSYQAAGPALSVVAYGMLFFGLVYIMTTIISASGRPGVSLLIGTLTVAASAAANALLIPAYGLLGAAAGTTIALVLGTAFAAAYLLVKFSALVSPLSLLRVGGAASLIYAISLSFSFTSRPLTMLKLGLLALIYTLTLSAIREIHSGDIEAVKRVLGMKKTAAALGRG